MDGPTEVVVDEQSGDLWRRLGQRSSTRRSDRGFDAGHEPKLGNLVQLAHVSRQFQECEQARSFARAKAVAQLLVVPRQEAGRIAVSLARLVCELLGLCAGDTNR